MAIFGDLGKALGLGSAEDIFGEGDLLPILATAAGFYFAPAMGLSAAAGAAGGAGLGLRVYKLMVSATKSKMRMKKRKLMSLY